ncbi:MAG TPA: penicillin-binding protein 1A [Burkholderiaceae bacterium]
MSDSDLTPAKLPPAPPRETPPAHWARRAARAVLRVFLTIAGGTLALLLAVAICVGIGLAVAYPNLPDLNALTDYRPKLPMRIFSADGVLLGEYGEERRQFTPIQAIPKVMRDAVLAIEDARFYHHGGVDYMGVIRAGMANVGEARSQGASTITMQVARNFYLSTEKTFTRKIYEILLALKIESQLSKDQILELYMNQIYLGERAYGFASASEIYFGKPLKDITIAEAAMLAGLPKAPSAYNPINNPTRAHERQQYIIDRMFVNGFITEDERKRAHAQVLTYRAPVESPIHAEYVAEMARQLVFAQYGDEAYTRGLNVTVTVDSVQQLAAYHALRRGIMDYERRQQFRGPEGYVDLPGDPKAVDERVSEALNEHPDNDDLRSAVVLEVSPKKVVAELQSGDTITVTGDGLKPVTSGLSPKADQKVQIRRGSIVRAMSSPKGDWTLTQLPEVEGAFVASEPSTGAIRALVGGFDYGKNKFNHVTQAWRQPGSSFKPFIYSGALEKGFTPSTIINDAPLFFDAGTTGSQPWEPKNYDGTYDGPMTMRNALAKSKNLVSIRILQSIGPAYAQQWISRFGFDPEKHPPYLTMALGSGSVTPLQMAVGYDTFATGGYRVNPMLITRITDARGKVLLDEVPKPLDESMRVIDARNAFMMESLLNSVTRIGTAARAQATLKRPDVYGKTGTTNDSNDAWFCGFQPSLSAIVWIGYDTPRNLGNRETGGGLALPVWIEFMQQALKDVPVAELVPPDGVTNINGEWYYNEFGPAAGVSGVGLDDKAPKETTDDEKKSILDLFKTGN